MLSKRNFKNHWLENDLFVFCGMAKGKIACEEKHHYAKKGNSFWPTLKEYGFIPDFKEPNKTNANYNYTQLSKNKIGLTDLANDQCGADRNIIITDDHIEKLEDDIKEKKPKIIAFNGKKAAKKFFKVAEIEYGEYKESNKFNNIIFFILPSTSGAAIRWWKLNKQYWCKLKEITKKIK